MNNAITKEKMMTVREVSEILGVTTEAIIKHIRLLYPNLLQHGKTTYLAENQIIEIKKKMQQTTKVVSAKTELEYMQMASDVMLFFKSKVDFLTEQNNRLETEKIINAPKIDFYNAVTGSNNTLEIGKVAKLLNKQLGRNKLFEILREKKILMNGNIPYQKYIDRGYFRVIESKYTKNDGSTHISLKTVVFQRGIDFINKIVGKK